MALRHSRYNLCASMTRNFEGSLATRQTEVVPHRLGACVGGAPGEALGVCVVRGCRGKEKSRQFPAERAVYLRGASPVSATTVGFCSLRRANTP